jgi:hypothetical protein
MKIIDGPAALAICGVPTFHSGDVAVGRFSA